MADPVAVQDWSPPVHAEPHGAEDWSDPVHHDAAPVPGTAGHPLDDLAHAAGPLTTARAALPPDPHVQMQRYAEAFNQPISDFGIVGDHIIRRIHDGPDAGKYARVEASVRGATDPIDAAKRAFDWVAGGAGPAIPAITSGVGAVGAGLLATPETLGAGTIPAAMAGGAAGAATGEALRQKLDALLAPKGQEAPMDYGNVAWQGAAGAAGPLAGKVIGAVGGRIAPVLANAIADELPVGAVAERGALTAGMIPTSGSAASFGLSPRVADALKQHITGREAELRQLREDAQALGVDLSLGQMTGSTAVQQAERQLARQPEGADAVAALRRSQNEEQIPGAVRNVLDDVAPDAPAGQQIGAFRDAAGDVVDKTFKAQSAAAKPVYASALDDKPDFWSDDLTDIMKRPSMQAGWREAQKDAAEEGRELPDLFTTAEDGTSSLNEQNVSWRDWQNIKVGLSRAIDAETDPVTGKMTPDGRRLLTTKKDLMGVLYKANSDWKAADAAYGSASDVTDAVLDGGVGFLNKMSGPDRQNMVNRVFSGQNLMPDEISAMRRQFAYAGKSAEWNGAVRSYVADKLTDAMTPTQGGELSNVGGKVYRALWGDQRQADIMKAALGGDADDALMARWDKLGSVLRAAARQLPEGSATATDTNAPGLVARGVQGAKYILKPASMGTDLLDGLSKMQNPANTQKLVGTLLTPEGDRLLKSLYPTTLGTAKANSILETMLTQAGVIEAGGSVDPSQRPSQSQ